ncbi:hypothetical protein BJ875DRAFT_189723 [Amylocarpus encephaloides]|uniref:Protein kinase domain-containing protein n=1 Tax=Amylocarpus encephaloides TaxID=45428 RepID=A0A9P7YTD1_9HELO|nr:hypothetical protein BJ875DRAFT_189723 [Amylocarpus encephaloides]
MAELILAIIGGVDASINLANRALKTYRAFRTADEGIDEKLVLLEAHWVKLEVQLNFLKKISGQLEGGFAQSQFDLLQKLQGKLVQATSRIEMLASKGSRKLKYAVVRDGLDELMAELEAWESRFDPTWYLIIRMSSVAIDSALGDSRQEQATTLGENKSLLDNIHALRNAIRPRTTNNNAIGDRVSINLDISGLHDATERAIPFSPAKAILRKGSTKLLISETVKPLSGNFAHVKLDVEHLGRILKQIDPDTFGLLRCHGILKRRDPSQHLVAVDMIYETPQDSLPPRSLRQLLLEQKPVSVSALVQMAKQLVRSVSSIHSCDFVHKNVRPENILVFPHGSSSLGPSVLLGFSQFRHAHFQTSLLGDPAWHRNLYRHPQRQGAFVRERYVMQHDIFSLGVCLLEIGLWRSFVWYPHDSTNCVPVPGMALGLALSDADFHTVNSTASLRIREHLVEVAKRELPSRLGDMYTDIVLACLNCLEPGNEAFGSEEDLADEDGILVGVRFVEKILTKVNEIFV